MGKNNYPDDFSFNGWSRENNYLMDGFEGSVVERNREKFRRSSAVMREWLKTDEGRARQSLLKKKEWDDRVAAAKREADTTEVLLLEKITSHQDGFATSELVAGCINMIARELAARGVRDVEKLDTKELILISNNLLALTKAAAAVKKEMNWKPNTVVIPVTQSSSKTGGVVGGLSDVIDLRVPKKG